MKVRNVLSLFDGISCGKVALERAGIEFENYYASEIDPVCIAIAEKNHPDLISLGAVENWQEWNLKDIDLIIGGSPCQGFSSQGHQLNFDDPRSKLFFTMVKIIQEYQPAYYMLENVVMRKEWEDIITDYMGVEPVILDSSLVSAQRRKRIYWANWNIEPLEDKKIHLKSILINQDLTNPAAIRGRRINPFTGKREDHNKENPHSQCLEVKTDLSKMTCLTTVGKDNVLTHLPPGRYPYAFDNYTKDVDWRYLTPLECERLQTLPENYTKAVSESQRYKALGNCWTVDVVVHILNHIGI